MSVTAIGSTSGVSPATGPTSYRDTSVEQNREQQREQKLVASDTRVDRDAARQIADQTNITRIQQVAQARNATQVDLYL